MRGAAGLLAAILLTGCSGAASYEHGGTTEGTGGPGDWVSAGAQKIEEGDYSKAIELLTVALNKDPDRDDAYYHRALARHKLHDIQGALEDLWMAGKINPDNAKAFFKRGWIYLNNLGYYRKAIRMFDRAIKINPGYADALYFRGLAYQALKHFDQAVKDISKAIESSPVGWSFRDKAEHDLAVVRLQASRVRPSRRPINPK